MYDMNLSNLESENQKQTFTADLNNYVNEGYIKFWNKKFIDHPKLEQKRYDYITNIKVYVNKDVNVLVNRFKNQKQWRGKFGAYYKGDYLFMSSLQLNGSILYIMRKFYGVF